MIPIKSYKLDILASNLKDVVKSYLNGNNNGCYSTKNKKELLDAFTKYFSPEYTIDEILLATPEKLEDIVKYYESNIKSTTGYNDEQFKSDFNYLIKKSSGIYSIFSSTNKLKYRDNSGYKVINAKFIIDELDIKVCPYCNRNFIYSAGDRRICQFDHYYPKEHYPFLAISFYNLIPSCASCNFNKKSQKDKHYNPYNKKHDFDNIYFSINQKKYLPFLKEEDIEIKLETKSNHEKIILQNHKEKIFLLDKLYERHRDYALEILKKREIYSEDFINELIERFGHSGIFKNPLELLQLIFGNYIEENDFLKRPLSKFHHDIIKELDFL